MSKDNNYKAGLGLTMILGLMGLNIAYNLAICQLIKLKFIG